ncbi:MAG: DUF4097 domain-containing protein [Bacteroides sp.]|nr:DUF4097 domain-containing protein [Bacteroides sp.]
MSRRSVDAEKLLKEWNGDNFATELLTIKTDVMRLFKHILSGLMLLTTLSIAAGVAPKKASKSFAKHGDFMSKDMIIDTSKMKNFRFSSDDITDPVERENMRMERRSNSSGKNIVNTPRKESEKLYTVKCVFEGEDMPDFAIYNPDFFVESRMSVWFESEETDTYYFQVPAGIYDIFTHYYSYVEGMEGWAYIIHEDVVVYGDTEITFSADELTEKVIIKPYLRNGEEGILPLENTIEEEPWVKIDYTNATIDYCRMNYVLFREGCNSLVAGFDSRGIRYGDSSDDIVFLSNKLSDKYHYIFQFLLEKADGEIQISTTDMVGAVSGVISNYSEDWVKYNIPIFSETPLYDEFGVEENHFSIQSLLWINDSLEIGGGKYVKTTNPEIYYTIQSIENNINLKAPIQISNVQCEITDQRGRKKRGEISNLPVLYKDGEWEYINQNHSDCGNFSYQRPEEGPIVEYPGVPAYCYFADEITQPIGNSSPVLALMTQVNEYPDATIFLFEPQAYIGRYGEVRNCDQWTLHTVVNLNGETVFDSNSGAYLSSWCIENSTDSHEKGLLEATFTNRNVLIDETISGFNITTIKVDERNEDLCTPTTQMLIFKNTDGIITDRFSKGEEGLIEFSAGDFNWVSTEDNWYYTCEEANVKVEYAPYGEDSFMPLEVEEIPENYYMPGFGYFYRGSLANVTMPSSNGWYDVRFTLTDKAGNEMVQHISPAFKIESNVSVAEVAVDGIKVWSVAGKVLASGSDIESMTLYSTDGKLITSTNGNSLPTNGYCGMGIVKVTSSNGITTTHKTIIK